LLSFFSYCYHNYSISPQANKARKICTFLLQIVPF
jgi:hypothetical protein